MWNRLARLGFCGLLGCAGSGTKEPAEEAKPDYDEAVIAKVCAGACVGKFARITVLRDAEGKVARYRFDGDFAVCSHPPRVFFDTKGDEVETIPEQPVTSDEEAKAFAKRQEDATAGATEAETLRCP